jgi:hypothetical protein
MSGQIKMAGKIEQPKSRRAVTLQKLGQMLERTADAASPELKAKVRMALREKLSKKSR